MRAAEFLITEALNQPYKILRWEKGDHGDVDAIARLDDSTFLSIMFNKGFKQETKEEAWSVEFFRNNSQEVTGEGDEFRVFATVLSAIQTFISDRVPGAKGKYKPNKIYFSASKKVEPGQKEHSRAGLYDSLVQRHAKALGFRAFRADTGNKVMYELSRIKPIAEDMSRRGFLKGAGAMAAGISAAGGAHANNQTDPNKLIAIVNIDGESKEFNLTGRFKGDVKSQLHQAEEFITEFLEKRDINFSNLELRYQGAVLKTQNIGSVKEEQGVAEGSRADNNVMGHIAKNLTGQGSPIAKIRHKRDTEREKLGSISYGYRQDPNLKTTHKQVPFSEDGVNMAEGLNEDAVMAKIEQSGQIIRILKKAHTVPFSDEKNWLLVDVDPAKGNKGLGLKWIPADTRFEWVRPYRDTVDENFADGKNPGRKGLAKRSGVDCKQPVAKLRSIAANSSGEKQRMAHWCANMKSGKKK